MHSSHVVMTHLGEEQLHMSPLA